MLLLLMQRPPSRPAVVSHDEHAGLGSGNMVTVVEAVVICTSTAGSRPRLGMILMLKLRRAVRHQATSVGRRGA